MNKKILYNRLADSDYYSPLLLPREKSVTYVNPVPKNVKSFHNNKQVDQIMTNNYKNIGMDYGPITNRYSSLRFYGNGPY